MTLVSHDDADRISVTVQARRRLSNQVGRAYRGSYGARTGLRTLGRSIARRLIDAGWSPEAISAALARVVLDHPASTIDDSRPLTTRAPRSAALVELTRQSVADVVLELAQRRPSPAI